MPGVEPGDYSEIPWPGEAEPGTPNTSLPSEEAKEESGNSDQGIKVVSFNDLMGMEFPKREYSIYPFFPKQGLVMIHGPRGSGKTQLGLTSALLLTSGGSCFGRWHVEDPRSVLLLDGEMPATVQQERLDQFSKGLGLTPKVPLNIYTPDLQPRGTLNLANPEDQARLEPYHEGIEVLIIDNLSTLCRGGDENGAQDWESTQDWMLRQRACGRSILVIHHSGKNGQQRGTSRREDVLDTVIGLRHPAGYTPSMGCDFEIHFEKNRGFWGQEAEPFRVALKTSDFGWAWEVSEIEQQNMEKVVQLFNDGMSQANIAREIGLTPGAVSKIMKKAKEQGLANRKRGGKDSYEQCAKGVL